MTQSQTPPDPFEDQLRHALADEAGGPAPDRLATRVAAVARTSRPRATRIGFGRGLVGGGLRASRGFGFAAVVVAVVVGVVLLRNLPLTSTGPGSSPNVSPPGSVVPSSSAPASPAPSSPAQSPAASSAVGPVGGPIPPGFQPVSVTFVSASEGWLLGSVPCSPDLCASVLRTTDGGRTWQSIPAPATTVVPAAAGPKGVSGIRFADALDGWAYGPEVWATHDGGATWHEQALPGIDSQIGVFALEAAGGLVHAVYPPGSGGGSLAIASSPVGSDAWTVSAVSVTLGAGPVPRPQIVLHGTAGWILENDRVVTDGARLVQRAWQTWQPPCLDTAGPADLAAADAAHLVAVCDIGQWSTPSGVHLYTSADGGVSFRASSVLVPVAGESGVTVAPSASGEWSTAVVAGSESGGGAVLVATFDRGQTWSVVHRSPSNAEVSYVGFTTSSQGVAIETAAGGTSSRLLMTRDGGHSWSAVTLVAP